MARPESVAAASAAEAARPSRRPADSTQPQSHPERPRQAPERQAWRIWEARAAHLRGPACAAHTDPSCGERQAGSELQARTPRGRGHGGGLSSSAPDTCEAVIVGKLSLD